MALVIGVGCSGGPSSTAAPDGGGSPDGPAGDDGGVVSGHDGGGVPGHEGGTTPPDAGGGGCGAAGGGQPAIAPLPNLAAQYQATFSSPPNLTDTNETPDGPLLGDGDVGVVVLGSIDAMTFVLGKNEFWSLGSGTVKAMARLSLAIPGMSGASYAMTESIGSGEVTGTFTANGGTIATTSWVQATDSTNNMLFTRLAYTGGAPQAASVSLAVGHSNTNPTSVGSTGDVLYEDVAADGVDVVSGYPTRKVRVATRAVGTTGTVAGGKLTFTLSPGATVTLATSIMSNVDASSYQAQAVANVSSLAPGDVATREAAHQAWWDAFHRMSFVRIPDKVLEEEYYASLYLLASASRTGEAPPGLWGNWVMTDPAWNSDYTLNYNYEAPFYATFPTNHIAVSESYDAPIIAWLPNAQAEAKANGWSGAYYRVHVGPLPNGSGDTSTHNQKFCGAFAATDMIMHYDYRPDPAYAAAIYPTLKQVGAFWESYLVKNGNEYDIVDDAQQEDDPSPQTNGVMSLGLVRMLLQACIDISTALNVDATERAVWQDRLANLAPFPTYTGCPGCKAGETVFRWTSEGRDWCPGNTIGIQHIYPASQIGLSSDPTLLQTAHNMIDVMARWSDGNGTDTFYPAAARVGYDPTVILTQLHAWVQNNTYPNRHIHTGGGGLENLNTVPATLAEMLVQSFQGTIRVFPDWPAATDAKFANLRAYGGFLVASERSQGSVQYVALTSELGKATTLVNPWGQAPLAVYRNGVSQPSVSGSTLAITAACPGDVVVVAPSGTSYASIVALMNAP